MLDPVTPIADSADGPFSELKNLKRKNETTKPPGKVDHRSRVNLDIEKNAETNQVLNQGMPKVNVPNLGIIIIIIPLTTQPVLRGLL